MKITQKGVTKLSEYHLVKPSRYLLSPVNDDCLLFFPLFFQGQVASNTVEKYRWLFKSLESHCFQMTLEDEITPEDSGNFAIIEHYCHTRPPFSFTVRIPHGIRS